MYEAGDKVGRFEVVRVLGEGATSIVLEVDDAGQRRALKVLGLRSSELKKRMAREGALIQRLEHPNVARLYEVLEVDQRPALLLELVDGRSLDAWLKERAEVDPVEAERITLALMDAVEHAHALGIVHRDLKPGNVLLTAAGEPKVVDFGLAKAVESDMSLTHPGALLGTPAFAAPEQLKDARSADARADVWSLGCIVYNLFCGVPPFRGKFSAEVMAAAAKGNFTPPEELSPAIPPRVARAIRAALVPDVSKRVPDVAAMRALLLAPDAPPEPTGGRSALVPGLALGGVAALGLLGLGVAAVLLVVVVALALWWG